ncbi:MAG: 2,3,4,5-tetrahydropyridine-2,6-dicarboxylate N-succinyltransferase, partial [Steroidobacteraceae bacterium]
MSEALRLTIETAFEKRAEITPSTIDRALRQAIDDSIGLLDSGQARVAEKQGDTWQVNEWLKKAVLLHFRANDNQAIDSGGMRFYDKVPLKFADQSPAQLRAGGVRVVP